MSSQFMDDYNRNVEKLAKTVRLLAFMIFVMVMLGYVLLSIQGKKTSQVGTCPIKTYRILGPGVVVTACGDTLNVTANDRYKGH